MYNPTRFKSTDLDEAFKLMEGFPFATVITVADGKPMITHLPLTPVRNGDSIELIGHMARANPHSKVLACSAMTAIFHGPHTYISPKWYEENDVPTWNYLAIHATGKLSIVDTETGLLKILQGLTDHVERLWPSGWSFFLPEDLQGERMTSGIVGFRMIVEDLNFKKKLNQSRSEKDHEGVLSGLSSRTDDNSRLIQAEMKKLNRTVAVGIACAAFLLFTVLSPCTQAKSIQTNELAFPNAPEWLTEGQVDRVVSRIQNKLEWSTRRSTVKWFSNAAEYSKSHSLGAEAIAVTTSSGTTSVILMGPTVTRENFEHVLGHELVHVIVYQKYKGAIPKWLEEGLANHLARPGQIDYQWLAKQPLPTDVRELAHPMALRSGSLTRHLDSVRYRYKASQALAEMLDKKCDLINLVRMSVARKMEPYIASMCEIQDLNKAFRDWVLKKSRS